MIWDDLGLSHPFLVMKRVFVSLDLHGFTSCCFLWSPGTHGRRTWGLGGPNEIPIGEKNIRDYCLVVSNRTILSYILIPFIDLYDLYSNILFKYSLNPLIYMALVYAA